MRTQEREQRRHLLRQVHINSGVDGGEDGDSTVKHRRHGLLEGLGVFDARDAVWVGRVVSVSIVMVLDAGEEGDLRGSISSKMTTEIEEESQSVVMGKR
jgi:hypothetical protein